MKDKTTQAIIQHGIDGIQDMIENGERVDAADLHNRLKAHNGYGECIAKRRLAYLQEEITQERISYGEMAELQSLKSYIPKDKIGLLTWVDLGPEMV